MQNDILQISEIRTKIISEILIFFEKAKLIPGIIRIALIGSLTTEKPKPKDVDLLINITNDSDLKRLAKLTRQLNGRTQNFNHNSEVFLADENNNYIGRICHWKNCGPGIRKSCDALHCGLRKYLHDDLKTITLDKNLILEPPIELWPEIIRRIDVPIDVEKLLLYSIK